MRRRFLLGVLAMGYSRAVLAAIQLLLVPALALSWGLPLYGQWLLLSSIPVFLGASEFGFSTTAGMRIIGEIARGQPVEALVTFRSARRMIVLLTGTMLVVASVVIALLPTRLLTVTGGMDGAEARGVLAILAGYGLLTLHAPLFAATVRAMGKTAQSIALDTTVQLGEGLAAIALALSGGTPLLVALAYLVVRAIGVAAMFAFAASAAPWTRHEARSSSARIREMWHPALAAMALPLSQAGYLQGSALAVGSIAGASAVPIYTALRTLSRLGLQFAAMIVLPLMPEYTAAHARGDVRTSSIIVGGLALATLGLGVGYGLIIGVFGEPLLAAWTHGAIQPPQTMIALTAVALSMSIVWNPLSDLLLAINRHATFAYIYVGTTVVAIGLTVLLVARFGITGAAGANLFLEGVMLVTVITALRRHGGGAELRPSALLAAFPGPWRGRMPRE